VVQVAHEFAVIGLTPRQARGEHEVVSRHRSNPTIRSGVSVGAGPVRIDDDCFKKQWQNK